MAQWSRHFSGNTHLSKVCDCQQQLQDSIDVYRTLNTQAEAVIHQQTVERHAEKLLTARIRATKARIASLDPRDKELRRQAESKLDKILNGGVLSILNEFDAADICNDLQDPR